MILRSLIHFELILVQGDKHGSSFSFLQTGSRIFPATFVEEAVFSPLYIFDAFEKNEVGIAVWIHICSTGLDVCFCASTMLFLLLLLCDIV
jgi:hypothetical protein